MGKKYTCKEIGDHIILSAAKNSSVEGSMIQHIPSPPSKEGKDDPIPTSREALHPVCPDPNKGFQKLSEYLVAHIIRSVMFHMKALCKERGIALDLDYWKRQIRFILSQPSTEEALVISSPAGSGKSTLIEAFMRAIVELSHTEDEIASSLVGVAVVLQKVEDLNRLALVLNSDAPQDSPNMVALQGLSRSGKDLGFCPNPGVNTFDECRPNSCPHSKTCELRAFHKQAPMALIVGLTQERFVMLREGGSLDNILYRLDEDGCPHPRRYLIFDEKFQMAQINSLDKPCIDQASIDLSGLIARIHATDRQIRSLQQSLSYHIDRPFQELRRSLCVETDLGVQDIQAGTCTMLADYLGSSKQLAFQQFAEFILCEKKQYATKHLRTALTVISSLYSGQECLFSKTNGFSITDIAPPPPRYGKSETIIFDATAEVDEDYRCLQNAKFSKGTPQRKKRKLILHAFTHNDLNVSKRAMSSPWKIPALCRFVAELTEGTHEDIFLCSYKEYAEEFAKKMREEMSPECFRHIRLMPDREQDTIPYFGGTNGSNVFNTTTTVFMLGYPRLNPRDYLIYACAAYGIDQISSELSHVPSEELMSRRSNFIWDLPAVKFYMAHHLAARMEQEIYRCKLRDPGFSGEINVYFFCPSRDMMEILYDRLAPNDIHYHDELPRCVDECKRSARRYKNGPTSYGRLEQFLKDWDGAEISVKQLRDDLKISPAVWKDLMSEGRVKELLERHRVQRKGRGPNASWLRSDQKMCA